MKQYKARELRSLARDQGIENWYLLSKKQLSNALNLRSSPKFKLTCVETSEVTLWENSCSISQDLKISNGNIFYALKVGKPLQVRGTTYIVQQLF